jgi:hypothetical protein
VGEAINSEHSLPGEVSVYVFGKPLFVPRQVLGTDVLSIATAAEEVGVALEPAQLSLMPEPRMPVERADKEKMQEHIALRVDLFRLDNRGEA